MGRRVLLGFASCGLVALGAYSGLVATATSTPSPTVVSQLLEGVYAGAANPSGVSSFASATSTTPTIASDYLPANSGWSGMDGSGGSLAWMFADGWAGSGYTLSLGVPIIPTDSTGDAVGTLAAGATGAYNSYFVTLAQTLVAAGESNAYLRLGWEFDGGWYAWSAASTTDEANFAQYFQQIVTAMRSVSGANFGFVWNPDVAAFNDPSYNVSLAYPGNAYVDYIGLDAYDQTWVTPQTPANAWDETTFPALTAAQQFASAQGIPLAITEWGVATRSDGHGLGDDPLYVNDLVAWMKDPANNVAFESYFNYDVTGQDDAITDGNFPNSLSAFTADLGGTSSSDSTTTTTTAPPATTTIPTPAASSNGTVPNAPVSLGAPTTMALDDEFNTGSLNTSLWSPDWFGSGSVSNGTVMLSSNVSVGANGLALQLNSPQSGALVSTNPSDGQPGHTGFEIAPTPTDPVFVEFEATLPATASGTVANWPALWLVGQTWPEDGEIDLMEGGYGYTAYHVHYGTGMGTAQGATVNDLSGTHTYGVLWTTTGFTFFYDGADVGTVNVALTSPEYILMENSYNSVDPVVFPTTMYVRYVRVWN